MIFVILTSISGVSFAKVFYAFDIGATKVRRRNNKRCLCASRSAHENSSKDEDISTFIFIEFGRFVSFG